MEDGNDVHSAAGPEPRTLDLPSHAICMESDMHVCPLPPTVATWQLLMAIDTVDEVNKFWQRLQKHSAQTGEERYPMYQRLVSF